MGLPLVFSEGDIHAKLTDNGFLQSQCVLISLALLLQFSITYTVLKFMFPSLSIVVIVSSFVMLPSNVFLPANV